eukprot:gene29541-38656_t
MMHEFNSNSNVTVKAKTAAMNVFLKGFSENYNDRYIDLFVFSPYYGTLKDPYILYRANMQSVRSVVKYKYMKTFNDSSNSFHATKVVYNLNGLLQTQAMYSILTTIFVAIVLIGGSIIFTNDAQKLVVAPIERMVNMVEAVAANPLDQLNFNRKDPGGKANAGDYETRLLESTIEKITGLLRVGFGEAGAGIISANLRNSDSASINPLLPGVRVYALIGFCDIHHFEDINLKLRSDVLLFVNTIAEIVHSRVHGWGGQCNKNLGNAFVIVWRIGDEKTLMEQTQGGRKLRNANSYPDLNSASRGSVLANSSGSFSNVSPMPKQTIRGESADDIAQKKKTALVDLRRVPGVDAMADKALIGYLKIIAELNRNRQVLSYRKEPRLTENGVHEFKVRMGFGAVGSLQKVDATYLSPHVNMAARLETSSRQYGVPLLASQDFYDLMSPDGQNMCRRLDVVTVKGSEVPIGIYTYDALQEQEFKMDPKQQPKASNLSRRPSVESLTRHRNSFDNKPSPGGGGKLTAEVAHRHSDASSREGDDNQDSSVAFMSPDDETGDVFDNDYDLITLRSHVDDEFLDNFKEAVSLYLSGDWLKAKDLFQKTDAHMQKTPLGGDGPSRTLLEYMKERNFVAPKDWKGYRPLTSK